MLKQSTSNSIPSTTLLTLQEDLSSILFMLLFHEISCLSQLQMDLDEAIINDQQTHQETKMYENKIIKNFKLHLNILKCFNQPFETFECKRKLVDKNYKFNTILKTLASSYPSIKEILNEKFRIFWNIKWHGGTIDRLIEDLIYNNCFNGSKLHIE